MATKEFKKDKIEKLKEAVQKAKVAIVTDYRGLTVAEITDLRRKLQAEGGDYTVSKNTLTKKAVEGTKFEALGEFLTGPSAIAFGFGDEVSPAKVVMKFIKDTKKTEPKGGVLDGKVLSVEEVKQLSNLPSKEELYAKILGSINSPASGIANSVSAVMRGLVTVIDKVREQKQA